MTSQLQYKFLHSDWDHEHFASSLKPCLILTLTVLVQKHNFIVYGKSYSAGSSVQTGVGATLVSHQLTVHPLMPCCTVTLIVQKEVLEIWQHMMHASCQDELVPYHAGSSVLTGVRATLVSHQLAVHPLVPLHTPALKLGRSGGRACPTILAG